jgi:hypothetical protein
MRQNRGSRARPAAWLPGLLLAAVITPAAPAQEQGKRVALIVGNDAYSVRPLQNAVNDARVVDKALQAAGFRTILRENASKVAMEQAMVDFLQALAPGDTALFYYAGHAVQIENENVLIPVDFEAANTVIEAKFRSFSLAMVFDYLKRARLQRSIVILDACRSNPVAESQGLQAGLSIPLNAGKETYIAFSTSPNHVATDNPDGKNSWFTEALGSLITQPGITIDELFTRVRLRVERATDEKQTPWSQTSLTTKFYFIPPQTLEADNDPSVVEKWMEDARRREQMADWPEAIALVDQVIKKKPGGAVEEAARSKLPYLTAHQEAQQRYAAGDFAAAAGLYSKALALDPFSMSTALAGVNSYLLSDRLAEAVQLLKAIRLRGTTESVAQADAMLKELAAVSPAAGEELKTGALQPPALAEVFSAIRFGSPDWEAAQRYRQTSTADLSKWVTEIASALPPPLPQPAPMVASNPLPPAPAAEPSSEVPPVNLVAFHVEIISATASRDLTIRRVGEAKLNTSGVQRPDGAAFKVTTDPPGANLTVDGDADQRCQSPCVLTLAPGRQVIHAELEGFRPELRLLNVTAQGGEMNIPLVQEFGFMSFGGASGETPVLLDGVRVGQQVPMKLQLPVGKYEIRTVDAGKIVTRQEVLVKNLGTVEVKVER